MQGENGYYTRLVLCMVFVSSVLSSSLPSDYVRFLLEAARHNESPERAALVFVPSDTWEKLVEEREDASREEAEELPRRTPATKFSRPGRSAMMRYGRNDGGQVRQITTLADLPVLRFG